MRPDLERFRIVFAIVFRSSCTTLIPRRARCRGARLPLYALSFAVFLLWFVLIMTGRSRGGRLVSHSARSNGGLGCTCSWRAERELRKQKRAQSEKQQHQTNQQSELANAQSSHREGDLGSQRPADAATASGSCSLSEMGLVAFPNIRSNKHPERLAFRDDRSAKQMEVLELCANPGR